MADSYTPNFGWTLPEIGASRDSWGAKLNSNLNSMDWWLHAAMPIGAIMDFAGPNAPDGWLICDGRLISRTTYSQLFAVISTYWGAGDGSTTFALPNTRGRSSVGPGSLVDGNSAYWSGPGFTQAYGYVWQTITQSNLPNYQLYEGIAGGHDHGSWTTSAGGHAHSTDAQGLHNHDTSANGGAAPAGGHSHYADPVGDHAHSYQIVSTPPGSGGQLGVQYAITTGGATTGNAGAHGHNISWQGDHQHYLYWDGNHAHNVSAVGDHAHQIYWQGDHQHGVWLNGSGGPLVILGPSLCVTKVIYAGYQAHAAIMRAQAGDPTVGPLIDGEAEPSDDVTALRQELAELRAMITEQRPRPRLIQAPLRGSH